MKINSILAASTIAVFAVSAQAETVWTYSNPAKTEGLTYVLTGHEVDADTWGFSLNISGINESGVDSVAGRAFLEDLSFSKVSGFLGAALPGATTKSGGLAANGCNSQGASFFCFDGVHRAVSGTTMSLSFTIDAPSANFLQYVPHLKVDWNGSANNYNLVSDDMIAAVPEPGTYALMIAGLAAVGFVARRRNPRHA